MLFMCEFISCSKSNGFDLDGKSIEGLTYEDWLIVLILILSFVRDVVLREHGVER